MKEWGELFIAGERIAEISNCIGHLAKCFETGKDRQQKLSGQQREQIYENICSVVCRGCEQEASCREYHSFENCEGMYQLLETWEQVGCRLEDMVDFQEENSFASRCSRLEEFMYAATEELAYAGKELAYGARMAELRMLTGRQLRELSDMLKSFSDSIRRGKQIGREYVDSIALGLRRHHIEMEDAVFLEDEKGKLELLLTVRSKWSGCITAKEVTEYVSTAIGRPMKTEGNGAKILTDHYESIHLVQDAGFQIFTGIARVPMSGNDISGDSFSVKELPGTKMALMLSDGMGSGGLANRESSMAIELLEEFLEAGFSVSAALGMMNTVFMTERKHASAITADVTLLDLYSGTVQFYKAGAAHSYIKRGGNIITIPSDGLPAGIFYEPQPLSQEEKKLYEGDYIIMMTDGMLEAMDAENKEQMMEGYLSMLTIRGPQEMADKLLKFAMEQGTEGPRDDMTVMVAAIYQMRRRKKGLFRHGF